MPRGSAVTCDQKPLLLDFNTRTIVTGFELNTSGQLIIKFNVPLRNQPLGANELVFSRPDGGFTTLKGFWYTPYTHALNPNLISAPAVNFSLTPVFPNETGYEISPTPLTLNKIGLSWFNCYSFGNGVESNRLRDDFNQVFVDKGVKVSTTIDEHYEEERRTNGLIYSGLYNSISGVNNLNQFIQAEKITKDINPTYGSIQKLFSRQTDLITLCEDKIIRIAANKDAVFNADGNPQLVASNNVLGQVLPFSGEYGISQNPESFVEENYRAYFTDKTRNAVIRLSKDGLTAISDHGMSNYFKQNLSDSNKHIGSYDDDKQEYNLTLTNHSCGQDVSIQKQYNTITFSESVRGWTSFKSFNQENGISLNNVYYTFKNSLPYRHHISSVDRNTFYGGFTSSSVNFLLNQSPEIIKSYKTLNYEGSQANVIEDVAGFIDSNVYQGYDNLQQQDGWFVQNINTDMQVGSLETFVEKEGKWFNYLKGIPVTNIDQIDTSEFSFQGIGRASNLQPAVYGCNDPRATVATYNPLANVFLPGSCEYEGCTNGLATNYSIFTWGGFNYYATVDDGSCDYEGCNDPLANNFNFTCNGNDLTPSSLTITTTNNTCCTYDPTWDCDTVNGGCMSFSDGSGQYATALDCDNAIGTSGGCAPCGSSSATGCTDPTAMNYDPTPNLCGNAALCEYYQFGCWDIGQLTTTTQNSDGYDIFTPLQTQLDSAPVTTFTDVYGTVTAGVVNQTPYEINSYSYTDIIVGSPTFGQTIQVDADNGVDPANTSDAGMDCSCVYSGCMDDGYCTDNPAHFDPSLPLSNPGSQFISTLYHLCPDSGGNSYSSPIIGTPSLNYSPWATVDDGSCCLSGCTDPAATNYDPLATCDDGSCNIFVCPVVNMPSFMLSHYPNLTSPKQTTRIIDSVFEAALESIEYEDMYGAGASNQIAGDQEICTSCLDQTNLSGVTSVFGLPPFDPNVPGATGQYPRGRFHVTTTGYGQNFNAFDRIVTTNYGVGFITSFNGVEELAMIKDNVGDGSLANLPGIPFTDHSGLWFFVHLQANTNFMSIESPNQPQLNSPYSIPQTPDYPGIEFSQLDLLIPMMGNFSLKNLPLKYLGYRAALDLSEMGSDLTTTFTKEISLFDCGITHLRLPGSGSGMSAIMIGNDTKFGTVGVDSFDTSPGGVQHYKFSNPNQLWYRGEQGNLPNQYSTYTDPSSQTPPQLNLPGFNSTLNTYLCDPVIITKLGVDLAGNIEPIYIDQAAAHSGNFNYRLNLCEEQGSYPPNYQLPSAMGSFSIQDWYDYPHPPWEDGSGNIVECLVPSGINQGQNNWQIFGYTPTVQIDAAWRRGTKWLQVQPTPGTMNLTNVTPECVNGSGVTPCNYRIGRLLGAPGVRIILLNLEKLTDIYIDPAMDPRALANIFTTGINLTPNDGSDGPPSQFIDASPDREFIIQHAGFTTLGCHDQLKIHVGTTTGGSNTGQLNGRHPGVSGGLVNVVNSTRVQDWEQIFGTNDPASVYYTVPELKAHFLRYFGPNHRFVD